MTDATREGAPTLRGLDAFDALLGIVLVVVTLVAYLPVRDHEFVNYDDTKYVTANSTVQAGLTLEGLRWSLDNRATANWHPLTWMSHMLDVQLYGLEPAGHHMTNVVLHALAALLLFLFLRRVSLATWLALFVAGLFALHPLRVESVAWVAERKDVLSGVFWMLTLLAYARYVSQPSLARHALVSLCLVLGLATKPMLVSLPLVLLLVDVWPLRRFESRTEGWGRLVREKLPWLALAVAAALVTLFVQSRGGAVRGNEAIDLSARLANAFVATATYVGKSLWPTGLVVFYPHPAIVRPEAAAWSALALGSVAGIVAVTVLAWMSRRRAPYLVAGWGWFLVTLLPVIGIVQVGEQAWADRYAYLPTLGLYLIVAGFAASVVATRPALVRPLAAVGLAIVVVATVGTRRQLAVWETSETLFAHAVDITDDNYIAEFSLGVALEANGDITGAIERYRASLAIRGEQPRAHNNLGVALQRLDRLDEARSHLEAALSYDKEYADAYNNLGILTARQRGLDRAAALFERSLELRPDSPGTRRNLAGMHEARGRLPEALEQLQEAARLAPDDPAVQGDMGRVLQQMGRLAEAVPHFERALEGMQASPGVLPYANGLAWIRATAPDAALRNGPQALQLARRCAAAAPNDPLVLSTLAAALAENSKFKDAVATQERALEIGQRLSSDERTELRRRVELYRGRQPMRTRP